MARAFIPELVLLDPDGGAAQLQRVFGFARQGDRLVLGDQAALLSQGIPDGQHGRVDHLALSVPDLDAALEQCLARGGRLSDATPEGALTIPEFWENGIDYVFLDGPEGSKVELVAQRAPSPSRAWGHDHIGISCAELAPMRNFFLDLGLTERSAVTLDRPEGQVDVAFLAWGDSVVELYCLPETRADPTRNDGLGFWRRLRSQGILDRRVGPEGVEILPL
jgi:catechol 2,3-dioxygenase-like lactoylglutathione lyase family enzyme